MQRYYSLWYNAPTMLLATGRQHRGCIIPQAVTHSLVLLKMGKIFARNTRWFKYDRDCLHSCLHTNHPGHI